MSLDKIMGELDRMTWERDSAKREIRILKDRVYGMNREIAGLKRGSESVDEMDIEAFTNARTWLVEALRDGGAEITDGGVGVGRADTGFILDGMPFQVSLRPRPLVELEDKARFIKDGKIYKL